MKFKTVILEDSMIEMEELTDLCREYGEIDLVNAFSDVNQATEYVRKFPPDLIISDIMLEGGTGLDFVKNLQPMPAVVLISSHTEYAIDAYELNVIDFIGKPVTAERFQKAMSKVNDYFRLRQSFNQQGAEEITMQDAHFFIRDSNTLTRIRKEDITVMESMGNYTRISLTNGKRYATLMGLKHMQEQLPEQQFARIHRSFIINTTHLDSITQDEIVVSGIAVPLSKSHRDGFMQKYVNGKLLNSKQQGPE